MVARSGWARIAAATAGLCVVLLSSGCDKLKGALSKGDAGESGASSGGILSFLGTDFEGEITANATSKGATQKMVFGVKKPKFRIDTAGGSSNRPGGSMIIDPQAQKGWVLMPTQKMATVIDLAKMKSMPSGQLPGMPNAPKAVPTAPTSPPKIDKTGKKDVVAGYSCEIWKITTEATKAEACVAEGITWIDLADLGVGAPEITIAAVASGANRFPLRVISYDAKGAEDSRMEVVKVDKKKLDDSQFVVPPDYRIADPAQMMRGLGMPTMPTPTPPKR